MAEKIVDGLRKFGLDLKRCFAQCYDGASVMSGEVSGVQHRLREIVGNGCIYIHCHAHRYVCDTDIYIVHVCIHAQYV